MSDAMGYYFDKREEERERRLNSEREKTKMRKWTDEEIDLFEGNQGTFFSFGGRCLAAEHIRELQEAVENLRDKFCSSFQMDSYAQYQIDELFWPAADAETREDPDDNIIGHEW